MQLFRTRGSRPLTQSLKVAIWGLFALVPAIALPAAAQSVTSTFDSDLDGWQAVGLEIDYTIGIPPTVTVTPVSNPTDIEFSATDGNPGGYARLTDAVTTPASFASAPSKFLGDLSGYVDGTLSFDHRLFDTGTPNGGIAPYSILITSGDFSDLNTLVWTAPAPTGATDWTSFDLVLDDTQLSLIEDVQLSDINPAFPSITPGDVGLGGSLDLLGIMSNVTSILVAFELVDNEGMQNQEHGGIDNVDLQVVPEPGTALLLGLGLLGLARGRVRAR